MGSWCSGLTCGPVKAETGGSNPLEPASAFCVTAPTLIWKGRRFCLCEREVRLELGARLHGHQMPVAHQDALEERSRQPVPLRIVGVVLGGARVLNIPLEAIEHLRSAVRLRFFHSCQRGP
jgi:hypothetical protein